ncbi:MAG: type I restriction endonuclease [Betaproteobacteria bacterium]|nr:type I restriction endonuclease [Betaproteobacteria bacterium]
MSLEKHIEEIRTGIKSGRFNNEAAVSQGIVLRLLHALSWPAYDTQIVCPEFSLQGRRVDYALCHPLGKPIAFVEVKQIGQSEGAERQLFEYAFHAGVPLAILTDGREWNFFLPGEQGDYGERRVYKLDIVERDISECVTRLNRYLHYQSIESGAAIEAAREDYRNVSRDRQMKASMPKAWARLIEEEDEQLLELVADSVENLCGYKPDLDTVARFLKERESNAISRPTVIRVLSPPHSAPVTPVTSLPQGRTSSPRLLSSIGFLLDGHHYPARNTADMLEEVFEALSKRDSTFLERFAALPKHGNKRRFIAKNPADLFPGRPDLVSDYSRQLTSGWWLGTNLSRERIKRIIEMACDVAQLRFGRDLQANLGE